MNERTNEIEESIVRVKLTKQTAFNWNWLTEQWARPMLISDHYYYLFIYPFKPFWLICSFATSMTIGLFSYDFEEGKIWKHSPNKLTVLHIFFRAIEHRGLLLQLIWLLYVLMMMHVCTHHIKKPLPSQQDNGNDNDKSAVCLTQCIFIK